MAIDLGELAAEATPDPRQPASPSHALWSRRPEGPALVVLLVLAAVLLGPSGAPPATGTEVVVPAGYSSAFVVGDMLLASAGGRGSDPAYDRTELAAFGLPDLDRRWQTPMPAGMYHDVRSENVLQAGDVLVVRVPSDQPDQECMTLALSLADGNILWCDAGWYDVTTDGSLIGHTIDDERPTIAALDPMTRSPRWSQPAPGEWPSYVRAGDGRVAAYLLRWPDGRLEMHDAPTGERLASRSGVPDSELMFVQGELVFFYDRSLRAYGLAGLEPRWSLPPEGAGLLDWNTPPAGCDHRPCYFTGGHGVVAIDPRTGAELWRDERWHSVRFVGDRLLLSEDWFWEAGASRARTVLAEADGTPAGDLAQWRLLHAGLRPGEQVVAVRPVAGNRILVADLGSEGDPKPLGLLNQVMNDCQWGPGFVSCRRLDGGSSLLILPG